MTAVLHQFDTIFFFPPRYVVDPHLPPSWLNMMHMSHIIPGFNSSITPRQNIRIRSLFYILFFLYFGGAKFQANNFGQHDRRQERRLMAVFSSIHYRYSHCRVLLPCVLAPSLFLAYLISFRKKERKKQVKKIEIRVKLTERYILDLYLYSFIIPIIPYMLIERIQIDPANVQAVTSALLANYALVCLLSSPIVGHYADKTTDRKTPLLVALAFELISAVTVAGTTNCELPFRKMPSYIQFSPVADYISFLHTSACALHRANHWSRFGNDAVDYWLFHPGRKY